MHSTPFVLGLALLASVVSGDPACAGPPRPPAPKPAVPVSSPPMPVAMRESRSVPASPARLVRPRRAPFAAGRPEVMSLTDENEVPLPKPGR